MSDFKFDPAVLTEIADRAAGYDLANEFCLADITALRERGYLSTAAPTSLGGSATTLLTQTRLQRQLAAASPATALAANMHQVWAQITAWLNNREIAGADGLLADIAAGEIAAFGISEPGNEAVLLDSKTTAEPTDDGYLISGTKIFTTLSPVWSRLGVHAKITSGPDKGKLVFGVIRRGDTAGKELSARGAEAGSDGLAGGSITHPGEWNTLGMRATHSYTTELREVPLKNSDVITVCEPGDGANPLVFAIFTNFSLLTASVYLGIADRALELAAASLNRSRVTMAGETVLPLDNPTLQTRFVEAQLAHRAAVNSVELLAAESDAQAARPAWFVDLAAAKNQAVASAQHAVTAAIAVSGAAAYRADSELSRLYRDVLAGSFHPSSLASLGNMVAGLARDS